MVTCPQCALLFPVNCSCEVEPIEGRSGEVVACTCPNCRYPIDFKKERLTLTCSTGDRLIVAKGLLNRLLSPARNDSVTFFYPAAAERTAGSPVIYIKRLIGLPGETIAIHYGKLYVYNGLSYSAEDARILAEDLRQTAAMHVDDPQAQAAFRTGKFQLLRKSPMQILAMRRLVYDDDHRARDLAKLDARWMAEPVKGGGSWVWDDTLESHSLQPAGLPDSLAWLRYRHLLPNAERTSVRPELITDFLGYNTWVSDQGMMHQPPAQNWVGDLILECEVTTQHQHSGQLILELTKGPELFRARFDMKGGECTLIRVTEGKEDVLARKTTPLGEPGTYRLRFANVDERLTLWVNDSLPFGDGVAYDPPKQRGPTENDLHPAAVAAGGCQVTISHLKLWRDTYYVGDAMAGGFDAGPVIEFDQPKTWEPLRNLPVKTYYVQPGHYFFLGDNSQESSDSRYWGVVPERLLMGKAFFRYYPFSRAGAVP